MAATSSTNRALLSVYEPAQGADLDGSGQRSGYVVHALTGTSLAYAPLVPGRLLDTRLPDQIGYTGPKPAAGQTIEVAAPAGAAAVVMNITGVAATAPGYVTVYPCGQTRPLTSNLNLTPGVISPNLSITKVGAGKVCIYTQGGTDLIADLIADLAGTFPT